VSWWTQRRRQVKLSSSLQFFDSGVSVTFGHAVSSILYGLELLSTKKHSPSKMTMERTPKLKVTLHSGVSCYLMVFCLHFFGRNLMVRSFPRVSSRHVAWHSSPTEDF